jgi:hypothetical protein
LFLYYNIIETIKMAMPNKKKNSVWTMGMPKGEHPPFTWQVWLKGTKKPIMMSAFDLQTGDPRTERMCGEPTGQLRCRIPDIEGMDRLRGGTTGRDTETTP